MEGYMNESWEIWNDSYPVAESSDSSDVSSGWEEAIRNQKFLKTYRGKRCLPQTPSSVDKLPREQVNDEDIWDVPSEQSLAAVTRYGDPKIPLTLPLEWPLSDDDARQEGCAETEPKEETDILLKKRRREEADEEKKEEKKEKRDLLVERLTGATGTNTTENVKE